MRWITDRLKDDRGATAVLVGILMVPLVGFTAIAVDVGALYVERGQLQNGADAAALAIAQECAEDGVCNAPGALADSFTDANANDGAANNLVPVFPNDHTVVVSASTRTAAGENAMRHPFAALIGVTSSTVGASATAEWGAPSGGTVVLPLALSFCEFTPALDGTLVLIKYDTKLECEGPKGLIPGGFGWLDRPAGDCAAFVDPSTGEALIEQGNSYPGACDALMMNLKGTTVLIPIFDSIIDKTGGDKSYGIYGFAAFTVTGWKFSGGTKLPQVSIDSAAPKCTGTCRGIQGYFDRWVSLADADAELGGPDLGAYFVRLID